MTDADDIETTEATRPIPIQSMARLIYGPPPRPRARMPRRWIFVAALLGMNACATLRPPVAAPDVDTVGQLAQGPSVWHAPTHASTDLTPAFQAVEGGDDATDVVTTVTRAPDASADATDAPETVTKVAHGF